jgi:SAM-dependent methyltransferase
VSYRSYVGIDISDIAINQARGKTAGNARTNKARFHQGDIVNYGPSQQFDVILLRDSLYYLPLWKVKQILDRYSKYLAHDGVFVVRMAWSDKYTAIVKAIEMRFKLLEKQWYENPKAIVLVFR